MTTTPRHIVALSGYAGSGKDTAALALIERGWTRVSFADKLRAVALAIDPLIPVHFDPDNPWSSEHVRLSNYVDHHGWTEAKRNPEVRGLLQRIGTDAGRKILGDNLWVDAAMADLPAGNIVITDCRFPNEAAAVDAAGGHVIRINRPGVDAVNAHPSETALDGYRFDGVITNAGSREVLGAALVTAVTILGPAPAGVSPHHP